MAIDADVVVLGDKAELAPRIEAQLEADFTQVEDLDRAKIWLRRELVATKR
jgi:hypothetical protein